MAFLPKLGQALAGFNAGFAGKGQEFIQQIDENRKQALLEDAFTVREQLKTGDVEGAKLVLLDRIDAIAKLGGDDRDTLEILKQITRGDIQGAFNSVSTVVNFAQQQKLLTAPDAAIPDKLERVNGQIINVNEATAVPIAGFTAAKKDRKTIKAADGFTYYVDTGERVLPGIDLKPDEATTKIEQEIESLTRQFLAQGLNQVDANNKAENIAFGNLSRDITGQGRVLESDLVSGTVTEQEITGIDLGPREALPPEQTLFGRVQAGKITGPSAKVGRIIEDVANFLTLNISGGEAGTSITANQQFFLTELNNMVRALTVNSRNPVTEMERIREELNIDFGFLKGEGTMLEQMIGLDGNLRFRLAQRLRTATDSKLLFETRKEASDKAAAIMDFLDVMGVPQQQQGSEKEQLLAELKELEG